VLNIVLRVFAIATGALSVGRDVLFLGGRAPEPDAALWTWLRICFVVSFSVAWYEQHRRIRYLEQRQLPKMEIRGLTPRIWPAGQGGISVTGKEYYFDVRNLSETEPLESVRVEVCKLIPDAIGYPNAPLHVRNDSYQTREVTINPGSVRQIDLITGPVNAPNSQTVMIIAHTVNEYRTTIPFGKYRITVRASAKNTQPTTAVFEAWVANNELQCVQL
jgi:hypothetical protein